MYVFLRRRGRKREKKRDGVKVGKHLTITDQSGLLCTVP